MAIFFSFRLFMEFSDGDPSFRARFLEQKFEPESFVQSIGTCPHFSNTSILFFRV